MDSFRKAYGALKDSTKVGLAKVNSEFKDLDIAIVKATNHVEYPPKERHVRKLLHATTYARPRTDIAYCIHALGKRLTKTRNWIVAIKTLIVIHRMLREGDATFMEELLNYSHRGYLFQLSNFKDESSPLAWDCSAWVRTYGLFLEERLECFRVIKYDIESERMSKAQFGTSKMYSRTRLLDREDLLEQLPALQQLLFRLIGCRPGGARYNFLVQYALALVLKESFKIYCAINDGIITLVDMFFDMSKHDAIKALNIYQKAGQQAENLAEFYDICRGLDLARTFQFPILRQPPPSFLATMEEYIREAPHVGSISNRMLEYQETDQEIHKFKEQEPFEEAIPQVKEEEEDEKKEETETETEEAQSEDAIDEDSINTTPALVSPQEQPTDLLGLNEINPKAMELEESNALALAIPKPGDDPLSTDKSLSEISNTSGWEVALVTAKSSSSHNNNIQSMDAKMAGGFNKLLLDSLYEDDTARRQIQLQNAGYNSSYGYNMPMQQQQQQQNPFNQIDDPFAMSNNIPPPTNVQLALMSHQQQHHHQQSQQYHHNMMMTAPATPPPYDPYGGTHYPQQQQQMPFSATPAPTNNPFGDPFTHHPQNSMSSPGNNTLI